MCVCGRLDAGVVLVAANPPFSVQSFSSNNVDGLIVEIGDLGIILTDAVFIPEDVKTAEEQLEGVLEGTAPKKWWHVFRMVKQVVIGR